MELASEEELVAARDELLNAAFSILGLLSNIEETLEWRKSFPRPAHGKDLLEEIKDYMEKIHLSFSARRVGCHLDKVIPTLEVANAERGLLDKAINLDEYFYQSDDSEHTNLPVLTLCTTSHEETFQRVFSLLLSLNGDIARIADDIPKGDARYSNIVIERVSSALERIRRVMPAYKSHELGRNVRAECARALAYVRAQDRSQNRGKPQVRPDIIQTGRYDGDVAKRTAQPRVTSKRAANRTCGRPKHYDAKKDKEIHDKWLAWNGHTALGKNRKLIKDFAPTIRLKPKQVRNAINRYSHVLRRLEP